MAEETNRAAPADAAPQTDSSAATDASPSRHADGAATGDGRPDALAGDEIRPGVGPGPGAAAEMPAGEAALEQAQARATEYYDAFLRSKAEMENVRRRAQDDVARAHKFAVEGFAESLLPVIDSLEAALKVENASTEAMRSGVELTLKQLVAAFEKNRLVAIDPAGQRFDPNLHQAISMLPSDEVPAQHVIATLQKGFTIADRVLRPALVTVSQGPQGGGA